MRSLVVALLTLLAAVAAAEELRDPTRPFKPAAADVRRATAYTLNAIVYSDERRVAVVNGQRVAVGDVINGAKVLDIQRDRLTLAVPDRKIVLQLRPKSAERSSS